MNIYLLTDLEAFSYEDTPHWESAVVIAGSPEQALEFHPCGLPVARVNQLPGWHSWRAHNIKVKHIGTANNDAVPGIVLGSYRH